MRSNSIIMRACEKCDAPFQLSKPSDPKRFCSLSCASATNRVAYFARQRDALLADSVHVLPDGTARLPLFRLDGSIAAYALIDAMDLPLVGGDRWGLNNRGYAYRRTTGLRRVILLHRVILGLPTPADGRDGDHVNRNRLDNRRGNLRVIPSTASGQNRGSFRGSRSVYRGVDYSLKAGRWRARIRVNGQLHHLGYFTAEEEAAIAARLARAQFLPYAVD